MKKILIKYSNFAATNELKVVENMNRKISFCSNNYDNIVKACIKCYNFFLPEIWKEFRRKWMTIFVTLLSNVKKFAGFLTMTIVTNRDGSLVLWSEVIYKKPSVARNEFFKWNRKGDRVLPRKTLHFLPRKTQVLLIFCHHSNSTHRLWQFKEFFFQNFVQNKTDSKQFDLSRLEQKD